MPFTTLVSTTDLHTHLSNPNWVIVDCRFSLADTERGRRAYRTAHIPGAVYAHLDEDISGPIVPGVTGRHPLPEAEAFAQTLSNWGIGSGVQVVAYDDMGGGIAARIWWMVRWLGHDAVAVLNGGWPAWHRAELPTHRGDETRPPQPFVPQPRPEWIVDVDTVARIRTDPNFRLLDARTAERYRGEDEPLDPIAGHIPGAHSAPFADNLDADGYFLPPDALRARFEPLLMDVPAERVISSCGSGVTANHTLLALAHAGLGNGLLYPGSWSHWITDPERPIARG